jgi:hypothetical protein
MVKTTWPFPSKDFPLTPWTPEQRKKWEEEHKVPDAPM